MFRGDIRSFPRDASPVGREAREELAERDAKREKRLVDVERREEESGALR